MGDDGQVQTEEIQTGLPHASRVGLAYLRGGSMSTPYHRVSFATLPGVELKAPDETLRSSLARQALRLGQFSVDGNQNTAPQLEIRRRCCV